MTKEVQEQITVDTVYAIIEENLEYIDWTPISPQERGYMIHVNPFPSTTKETYLLFIDIVERRLATNPLLPPPKWERLKNLAPEGVDPPESLELRMDRSFTIGFGVNRRGLQRKRWNPCCRNESSEEDKA